MEGAQCIRQDSKLDNSFWGPAVLTAAHIHNRLPSPSHQNASPLVHWTGKEPGIGHLLVFGATTWVHIPKEKRRKLGAKSEKCILIGYEEEAGSKVYLLYNQDKKTIILSRDIITDGSPVASDEQHSEVRKARIEWEPEPKRESAQISENITDTFNRPERITPPPAQPELITTASIQDTIVLRQSLANLENMETRERGQQQVGVPRSERNRRREEMFAGQANFALMANTEDLEPQTLTDALSSTEKDKWREAWESELTSLSKNNTWVLEPLPAERTVIGCRWLFRRKKDGRYKAWLVAKGYSQKLGIDYQETFAPVAKFTTIRTLLASGCESDWEIQEMDVKQPSLIASWKKQFTWRFQKESQSHHGQRHQDTNHQLPASCLYPSMD